MADSELKPNDFVEGASTLLTSKTPLERIEELKLALREVAPKFQTRGNELKRNIYLWLLICLTLIGIGCFLAWKLLTENLSDSNAWHDTAIRIVIATGFFALVSFCFRILKSYIHMKEKNNHCITVIDSMAYLVESTTELKQRDLVYNRLIEIVTNQSDVGLTRQTDEFKSSGNSIIEVLSKLIESNKHS